MSTHDAIKTLVLRRLREVTAETGGNKVNRIALLKSAQQLCRETEQAIEDLIEIEEARAEANDNV